MTIQSRTVEQLLSAEGSLEANTQILIEQNRDNIVRRVELDEFAGGVANVANLVSYTGNTGGSGSANSGAQYVELTINGTTYKILHDGTV